MRLDRKLALHDSLSSVGMDLTAGPTAAGSERRYAFKPFLMTVDLPQPGAPTTAIVIGSGTTAFVIHR